MEVHGHRTWEALTTGRLFTCTVLSLQGTATQNLEARTESGKNAGDGISNVAAMSGI